MIGHLHCEVFNQEKFLLNGVRVQIRLVRSRDSFCLSGASTAHRLHMLEATLLIRKAKIDPSVIRRWSTSTYETYSIRFH